MHICPLPAASPCPPSFNSPAPPPPASSPLPSFYVLTKLSPCQLLRVCLPCRRFVSVAMAPLSSADLCIPLCFGNSTAQHKAQTCSIFLCCSTLTVVASMHMDARGCTWMWMHMDTRGCTWMWMHMDARGCTWIHVDARGCGCTWMHVDAHGCMWMLMDAHGCPWMHMAAHGCLHSCSTIALLLNPSNSLHGCIYLSACPIMLQAPCARAARFFSFFPFWVTG